MLHIKPDNVISLDSLNVIYYNATYIEHLLLELNVKSCKYIKTLKYEGYFANEANIVEHQLRLDVVTSNITIDNTIYENLTGVRFYFNHFGGKHYEIIFNTPEGFEEYKKVKFKELIEVLKQVTLI